MSVQYLFIHPSTFCPSVGMPSVSPSTDTSTHSKEESWPACPDGFMKGTPSSQCTLQLLTNTQNPLIFRKNASVFVSGHLIKLSNLQTFFFLNLRVHQIRLSNTTNYIQKIPKYWHEVNVNKLSDNIQICTIHNNVITLHRYAKRFTLKNKPLIHFLAK